MTGLNVTSPILQSCTNTTLDTFIKVICQNNVELVGGAENWATIIDEYSELIKDESNDQMLVLRKEHEILNNKLSAVQHIINSLYLRYNKELCDTLNLCGFRIRYTEETLIEDLKKTAILAKNWVIQRDETAKELNKFVTGKKNTEADYDMYLTVLSKFIGYRIDKYVCTVSEYAGIRNNYEAEIKRIEEQLNKA